MIDCYSRNMMQFWRRGIVILQDLLFYDAILKGDSDGTGMTVRI